MRNTRVRELPRSQLALCLSRMDLRHDGGLGIPRAAEWCVRCHIDSPRNARPAGDPGRGYPRGGLGRLSTIGCDGTNWGDTVRDVYPPGDAIRDGWIRECRNSGDGRVARPGGHYHCAQYDDATILCTEEEDGGNNDGRATAGSSSGVVVITTA